MQEHVIRQTGCGRVKGCRDRGIDVFKNIPYAKPPVGKLRFGHAQPAEKWSGVLDATHYGDICPQNRKRVRKMSENCLTLNIWSPPSGGSKLPVMFFIHGGSFVKGAGSDPEYDGYNLAAQGTVVVTINYRLGAFGFMDFSYLGEQFQTNCGLSDIVQALKWTYENIEAFGGDSSLITVFGQSAGAIAASALSVMPAAKPYIARIISMSGGPIWMHTKENAGDIARQYTEYMGIGSAKELMDIPAAALVAKQKKFMKQCKFGEGTFSITVDGDLLPEFPIPAAEKGETEGIPVLIGTTNEELSFAAGKLFSKVMVVKDVILAIMAREKNETRGRITAAYERYGKRARCMLMTDHIFRMSSVWYAQAANRYSDVWMYSFDYETPVMKATSLHACHSTDIPYVFGNFSAGVSKLMFLFSPISKGAGNVSAEISRDFITFAYTGTLPWQKSVGKLVPAKSYDSKCVIKPMVEPDVAEQYEQSEFKRVSCAGSVHAV